MKRGLLMMGAVLASQVAHVCFAMDAVWYPTTGYNTWYYWTTPSNWRVADEVPEAAPITAEDNAYFPYISISHTQMVRTGRGDRTSQQEAFTVNSVTGDLSVVLMHGGTSWNSGDGQTNATLTVLNPNGFEGFWGALDTRQSFAFPTTATFTPEIHNLDAQGRVSVDFSGAGEGLVDALYNPGAMTKYGNSPMTLNGTLGGDTQIYVAGGGITLKGHAAADTLESVMDKAYLHLDASDASTFDFVAGSATAVTNWHDVRGADYVTASVPTVRSHFNSDRVKVANAPFISTELSPTGLNYLDFGSCFRADEDFTPRYGPTNCCMKFPQITNGAEVFVVTKYHEKMSMNALLGDSNYAPMQPYGGSIFGGSANKGFAQGHFYMNGFWKKTNYAPEDGLTNGTYVLSFGPSTNAVLNFIGVDQDYSTRCGGMMIGEILIFTNRLSNVDRLRVHNHLKRKWVTGDTATENLDAGAVVLLANDGSVGVEAGQTALVRELVASNGTLVKTGGGTLQVNALYPSNATIDVRAGAVKIKRVLPEPTTTAPATKPLVWLDASKADTITTAHNDTYDKDFVTAWKDCRTEVDIAATPLTTQPESCRPTVKTVQSPTALDVVDFGDSSTSISSLIFPWYGKAARVYSGFIVMRQIANSYSFVPFFGCYNMCMERECVFNGNHARILNHQYPHPGASAALWTVNGRPVDPTVCMPQYFGSSAPFIVVAFKAQQPLGVDAIALGRNQTNRAGGIQVGEFILYDREITDAERLNTEAYLMKRWLGEDHPCLDQTLNTSYIFPTDKVCEIDSAVDMNMQALTGGNGNLVKKGAGNLTLAKATITESFGSSITVAGGTLSMPVETAADTDPIAYHFDASDETAFTTFESGGKDWVTEWKDVRRNGLMATNFMPQHANGNYYCGTNITLTTVTFPSGETKRGVNFGSFQSATGGGGLAFTECFSNIREGMSVWENQNQNWQCLLFSSRTWTDYYRGNDGAMLSSGAVACTKNGEIWVDGSDVTWDTPFKDNLPHIVDMVPTAATRVDTLSLDRMFGGGQILFEQIGFTEKLSDRRRQYYRDYLRWKWFKSVEKPVWYDMIVDTLAVSNSAALTLTGSDVIVQATNLRGTGTINADSLVNIASLAFDEADIIANRHMTVSGTASFVNTVSVALNLENSGRNVAAGTYTLLSAEAFENANLANWSITGTETARARKFTLDIVGNALILKVTEPGTIIYVR